MAHWFAIVLNTKVMYFPETNLNPFTLEKKRKVLKRKGLGWDMIVFYIILIILLVYLDTYIGTFKLSGLVWVCRSTYFTCLKSCSGLNHMIMHSHSEIESVNEGLKARKLAIVPNIKVVYFLQVNLS